MIGFVGSVFSPYCFRARQSASVDPENHCAINVALYGKHRRWSMKEYGTSALSRDASFFNVGASAMRWEDGALVISVDACCSFLPFPLKGKIVLEPQVINHDAVVLAQNGQHHWQAVAPAARVEVAFQSPSLTWTGHAYHDMNWGDAPLESGFTRWSWLRARTDEGTQVIYDADLKDGTHTAFALCFGDSCRTKSVPPLHHLPKGFWRMDRPVRSEQPPHLIAGLEDTPFYTRNHVRIRLDGKSCEAVHESLSLERFVHPITQWMLPYRMPRA